MKFTSKRNKKTLKTKWLYTLILVGILLAVCAVGFPSLYLIRKSDTLDLTMAYDQSDQLYGSGTVALQKSPSYAAGLCVADQNISRDGVSVSNQVMGALFDLNHRKTLFAQNIHEKAYPASITKVMTALIAFQYGNLSDTVTITEDALNLEEGSTEIGFQPGDQVTLGELLHGLLIYSGNDAAMAIAQHVGGSVDHFVELMNEEANRIGATNTHFVNPSGLHDENHYTTVYDIYLILNEAIKNPYFLEITQCSSYEMACTRGEEVIYLHLDATDQYLTRQVTPPKNVTILGGKTGTTGSAGSCLALVSQNAYGEPYISIILHAPTKGTLYDNMNQLLGQINT